MLKAQDKLQKSFSFQPAEDIYDNSQPIDQRYSASIKSWFEQYLQETYPGLNFQQICALLSFNQSIFQHNCNENKQKGNNILEDYISFGSMSEINYMDQIIKPVDYQIPCVELIQGLLVDEANAKNSLLQKHFIMFLKFLNCKNYFLPINAIKRIFQFIWLPPNTIMDIGTNKFIYVSLFSDDDRNIINLDDKFLLAENIKMTILNDKPISIIMQEQDIELTVYNIQSFIIHNYRDLIGLNGQNSYLLYQALQAQNDEQLQIFAYFKPFLQIKVENLIEEKIYKIIGSQNQISQFGSCQSIHPFYRLPNFSQIDNFQFYIMCKNNKWLIYDGKYSNQHLISSQYGTWKLLGNKHRTLQKGEKIRIGNTYYTLNSDHNKQPISFKIDQNLVIKQLKLPNKNSQKEYVKRQQKVQHANQYTLYLQSMSFLLHDEEYQNYQKNEFFERQSRQSQNNSQTKYLGVGVA